MFGLSTAITFGIVLVSLSVTDESAAYWIVLSLGFLFGCCYAIMQAALYGLAGPSAALMNNLNLGIGLSGLSINLLRVITLASIKDNDS